MPSTPQPPRPTLTLRDPVPGDIGYVIHRQAMLYAKEYGWDWTFEALVAEIGAAFIKEFDPDRERCWIAELDGRVVGSVFVVEEDADTAKLRMLYVEPDARGHGIGRKLVRACLAFARDKGYRRMLLWTNDCLDAARAIYVAEGFSLIEETPHHSFGKDLVGQVWAKSL